MAKKLGWDKYETALLIDACLQVANGASKQKIVKTLSAQLRQHATAAGIEIDHLFRNENGIALQMLKMDYLLTDGVAGLPGASKFFAEMVALKRASPSEFEAILNKAKLQINSERAGNSKMANNRSNFDIWIRDQRSLKIHPILIIATLDDSSDFAQQHGISKVSIWEINSASAFSVIYRKLSANRLFRVLKRDIAQNLDKVYGYYKTFLEETVSAPVETSSPESNNTATKSHEQPVTFDSRFMAWMQTKQLSENTGRSYLSSIRSAEAYAKSRGIANISLTSGDNDTIVTSIDKLLSDSGFIQYNKMQYNRFAVALRKLRDYITEAGRRENQLTSDTELELLYPTLYRKLYSVSKVYDAPQGMTVEHISAIIGMTCPKAELVEFLDNISWATKISNGVYSFSPNAQPITSEEQEEKEESQESMPTDFNKDAFIQVLLRRYPSGMQFDSIDIENFKDTYESLYDETLSFTDEELELRLKYCGIIYKERLFPAEGIIDNNTKKKLFAYIENQFAAGINVLYYKAIFDDLSDAFAYCFSLTDAKMLKAYIEFTAENGKYYFFEDYMTTEENVTIDHSAEIVNYMLSAGKPLSYEEVYEGLSHISQNIIYREIHNGDMFLMDGRERYFHIDIFEFSSEDGEKIATIFNKEIEENGFVIWSNVYESIKDQLPIFVENNLYLSPLGLRNALAHFMSKQFSFDGEVISAYDSHLGMADVFQLYAKHNAPFSDTDLYEFSKQVDTVIYFWSIAKETVRVNKNLFIPKNHINFNIEAIDKALETYLSNGYILIKDVDSFLVFPNVGFEWNAFLLESYLLYYSQKFCLVNNGTSLNNVAGAMTKKGSEFTQFVDICAHALANSDVELKKTDALNYLAEINLITRRSYRDVDLAMTKARQLRNLKG